MEDRILFLLKKYAERNISPKELGEIRDFMQASEHNRKVVDTFIQLHKTEIQADALKRLNKEEAWRRMQERVTRSKRWHLVAWTASVAAILIMAVSATLIYTLRLRQPEMTMTAVMQTQAQNHAVITLTTGEDIEVDGTQTSQLKGKDGKVVCENRNGKIVYFAHTAQPVYNKVSVKEGSTYKIVLSDGTNITLASGSEIVYPIGGDKRDVKLKGEALFDVTHDDKRPFTVECANGCKVTVLGTRFNVSAHKGKPVTVTVESGKVGVTYLHSTTYLNSGEQVSFGNGADGSVSQVDARIFTSWASGIYEFNDVPMQVITRQLSLWYGVEFEYASPRMKGRKFTGALLRDEKLGYTLSLLKEVSNLKFSMNDNKIVIE